MSDSGRRSMLVLILAAMAVTGCAGAGTVRVLGLQGVDVPAGQVDPLQMLPSGASFIGSMDVSTMRQVNPAATKALVQSLLPAAGLDALVSPSTVRRLYAAIYSIQGADFCAVVEGAFEVQGLAGALEQVRSGGLVKTAYGPFSIYSRGDRAFVVLSGQMLLAGNEVAVRRALDALRYRRLRDHVAPWMRKVLATPGATFAFVGDADSQPVATAFDQQWPVLGGLRYARVLGNFRPPGLNVVGTLTYGDAVSADRAKAALSKTGQLVGLTGLVAALGGVNLNPRIDASVDGEDMSFATQLDAPTVAFLMGFLTRSVRLH